MLWKVALWDSAGLVEWHQFCFTQVAAGHEDTGNHFSRYQGSCAFALDIMIPDGFHANKCPLFLLCSLTRILNSMYFLIYI